MSLTHPYPHPHTLTPSHLHTHTLTHSHLQPSTRKHYGEYSMYAIDVSRSQDSDLDVAMTTESDVTNGNGIKCTPHPIHSSTGVNPYLRMLISYPHPHTLTPSHPHFLSCLHQRYSMQLSSLWVLLCCGLRQHTFLSEDVMV